MEQKIPVGVQTILPDECCLPATYCAKVYEIKNNSELSQWEQNLFCERDDETKKQSWVLYSNLPKKIQEFVSENIEYWKETSKECDIFRTINVEKTYFAACLTESSNKIRTSYHSIFLLNEDKTLFIDIQYIY